MKLKTVRSMKLGLIGAAATACVMWATASVAAERGGRADATWIGPFDGLWSVAENWSGGVVPNGADWTVYIDSDGGADSCAHINGNYTVGDLTIDELDRLRINDARVFYLADGAVVTNNGELYLDSTGNYTYLWLAGPTASLTGDGELVMSDDAPYNRLYASDWTWRLTNTGNHTIRGGGNIGASNMLLSNEALIQADSTAVSLTIDVAGSDAEHKNFNSGTMQAIDGAMLWIWHSAFNNAGGVIRALDGSSVGLGSSSHIYNGTLTTEGSGEIFCNPGNTVWIQDLLNSGSLSIRDNAQCRIRGTITNDGTIALDSTGNYTYLWLDQPMATLTGAGTLRMGDAWPNYIYASDWHYRLTHTGDHTMHGGGNIGGNNMLMTNESLIQADLPTTVLYVDLGGNTTDYENFNTGTMQATDGGTLSVWHTPLNNADGVIQALDGSFVDFGNSSHVYNGLLTTLGTGLLRVPSGQNATIQNLSLAGNLSIQDNAVCYMHGVITNDGVINIDSTGNYTYLWLREAEGTLTGSGEVVLNGNQYDRIYASDWTWRLTNTGGHTIRGGGNIGANNILFTNDSLVQADSTAAWLVVDLGGGDAEHENFNTGTMQAVDGATLWISRTTLNNDGGVIKALNDSFVGLGNSAHVYNGTLTTEGAGLNYVHPGHTAHIQDLTNDGLLSAADNTQLRMHGTITNNGTITLDSTGNYVYLWLAQPTGMLDGTGEVVLGDNQYDRIYASDWQWILTNGPEHTIRGGGNIGANNMGLVNQGFIIADVPGGMTIDVAQSGFDNAGLVHVTGDGYLHIAADQMNHHGNVVIDETRTLHRIGNFTQTGGQTTVLGTLELAGGVVDLQGGTLEGTGDVAGTVQNGGGIVEPGMSAGTITVDAYNSSTTYCGTLAIEIGGSVPDTDFDVLSVDGTATLGGILRIELVDPFVPQIGDTFEILQAATVTDRFDCFEFPDLAEGYFSVEYGPDVVTVMVVTDPPVVVYADTNDDGVVDVLDLLRVLNDWGNCDCDCCPADIDGSGTVDILDLLAVLANWS